MGDCYKKAVAELRAGNWENARDLVIRGATEEGCGMCMWWMYDAYVVGYWFVKSKKLAKDWLNKAVATNHPVALAQARRDKVLPHLSHEQEEHIFRTNDSFSLFLYFYNDKSDAHYPWLIRAGNEGNIFALYELMDAFGEDGEFNPYMELAADTGYAVSQWRQGECLCEEHDIALYKQGECLCEGQCITVAISWLKKSAAQGYHWPCLKLVKDCYDNDPVAQLFWMQKVMATFKPTTKYKSIFKQHVLQIMKDKQRIFSSIERCRAASLQLICIRQYRNSVLSVLPKDVVRLIAKTLWKTTWHEEDVWGVTGSAEAEPVFKKIKK